MNAGVAQWLLSLLGLGKTRPGDDVTDTVTTKPIEGKASTRSVIARRRVFASRFSISTSGLGTLGWGQSEAEEARRALKSLNTRFTLPKVNPADPQSVQESIRQMDLDIDAKLAPYSQNKIVAEAARKLKSDCREMIQKQLRGVARSTMEKK